MRPGPPCRGFSASERWPVDLSRTRNQLQHVYIDVSADDVRMAVRRLRSGLPALVKALNAWLTRYGVGV